MRKPRDYNAELKLLSDKAKQLKERKLAQLGELVIATGADAMPIEALAGALLIAVNEKDASAMAKHRARGEAFFRGNTRRSAKGTSRNARRGASDNNSAQSTDAGASAS